MTIQTRDISQLYKELAPQVFRFCMFISRDKTIAEDATSEAFTKALDKYDLAMVENPKSLLFTIAKNHILGAARKTKKLQPVDDVFIEQVEEASKGTEQQAIEAELVRKLESALGKLDPETRTVIALRTYEELSFSEIAEIIQDTEGATKMRYYRGISELNEIMNKQKTTKARVFALPVLLLGVREVFALSNYHVSPAFMASLWKGLVTNFSLPISNSMNIINIIKAKLGLAAVSTKLIVLGGAVIIVPLCGGIVANVIWPTRSECAVDFTDGVNGAMVISGDRSCQFTVLRFERDMTGSSDECLTSDNPSTFRAGTGELRPNPAAGKCVQLDIPGFGGV
jgi:RNA polymerase sigma-70 factor (ECF subfamily)